MFHKKPQPQKSRSSKSLQFRRRLYQRHDHPPCDQHIWDLEVSDASGMGSYHGKESFELFSHRRSIVKKYNWIDLPIRYQPYTAWKRALLELFLQ